MKRRCEICAAAARHGRLCDICREALVRVQRVWMALSVAERGSMHYQAMQQRLAQNAHAAPARAVPEEKNSSSTGDVSAGTNATVRQLGGARCESRGRSIHPGSHESP